jgi:oligopeptide transport system substrate-binding protein
MALKYLYPCYLITLALSTNAASVDPDRQSVTLALGAEPTTLNSMKAADVLSGRIIGHLQEGLLRYDLKGDLRPAIAESWEMTDTGATFNLRSNARWSDGSALTAHDFVFAWQTAVSPLTASEYAFVFSPVKNAGDITRGSKSPASLGVRAADDYTLVVEFESTCPYFLELAAFASFFPIKESFYDAKKDWYAADKEDLLYNGPFTLKEWVHGASMVLAKNEFYWDKKSIHLNEINFAYVTSDTSARFNLFKNDQIAMVSLNTETLSLAVNDNLKVRKHLSGQVQFLVHNFKRGRPTANINLRRAIQYAYNSEEFANRVTAMPGTRATDSLFPSWIKGIKGRFRREFSAPSTGGPDIKKARAYYELAVSELGEIPPLILLQGTGPTSVKMGEYLQGYFKTTLGMDIRLDNQVSKQYYDKLGKGNFDIALWGWLPDYNDILTYADLMASWNLNNRGGYKNEHFDAWVRQLQNSTDVNVRMNAAGELQNILFQDAVILPQLEISDAYIINPGLENVVRRRFGADPDFVYARVRKTM